MDRPVDDNPRLGSGTKPPTLIKAAYEFFHNNAVQPITQDKVLNARINVWIVVDLNHQDAISRLLQIDAIKAIANQCGSTQCRLHDLSRRILDGDRCESTRCNLPIRSMPIYLPMLSRHEVFTGEQWLAGENADPPVVFRIDILLGQIMSERRDNSSARRSRSARFSTLWTPNEKALSGTFTTMG